MVAWFPSPLEDMERYFQRIRRLNRGLDTGHWRVYERKEEPSGVHLVLSIDSSSVAALKGMGWRPFRSVGESIFPVLV
jgi:hypothetical protein